MYVRDHSAAGQASTSSFRLKKRACVRGRGETRYKTSPRASVRRLPDGSREGESRRGWGMPNSTWDASLGTRGKGATSQKRPANGFPRVQSVMHPSVGQGRSSSTGGRIRPAMRALKITLRQGEECKMLAWLEYANAYVQR